MQRQIIDTGQLKLKITRYCAWRERCCRETREKLVSLGASGRQVKEIMAWLAEENYIDDQRFAASFARGKFTNNNWGKQRIIAELRLRHIEDIIINEAVDSIADDQYLQRAEALAQRKYAEVKAEDDFIRKQKTAAYLVGKGFEFDIARKATANL